MPNECYFCGKRPLRGYNIARRGKAKKEGGVGIKTLKATRRTFRPNLQHVRAYLDGKVVRIYACVRCIKAGKVNKPPVRTEVV